MTHKAISGLHWRGGSPSVGTARGRRETLKAPSAKTWESDDPAVRSQVNRHKGGWGSQLTTTVVPWDRGVSLTCPLEPRVGTGHGQPPRRPARLHAACASPDSASWTAGVEALQRTRARLHVNRCTEGPCQTHRLRIRRGDTPRESDLCKGHAHNSQD